MDPGPRWPREQPAPCRPPVCRRLLLRAGMEQHQQVYPSFLVGSPRTCPGFLPHLPGLCSPGRFLGWQEPSKRPLVPVGSICFLGISESHWVQLWNLSLR